MPKAKEIGAVAIFSTAPLVVSVAAATTLDELHLFTGVSTEVRRFRQRIPVSYKSRPRE